MADPPQIYRRAAIYDIAFSYREISREVDALVQWFRRASGRPKPRDILELGAGPAAHSAEFARQGVLAVALDRSADMCAYAKARAETLGCEIKIITGDMVEFELGQQFDLAIIMNDTVSHITSSHHMDRHLRSVADHLRPGGVYIIECANPFQSVLTLEDMHHWSVFRDGIQVDVTWEKLPTCNGIRPPNFMSRVAVRALVGDQTISFSECLNQRSWSYRAIKAALRRVGCFEMAGMYGDFGLEWAFNKSSWRMICVLRRCAATSNVS